MEVWGGDCLKTAKKAFWRTNVFLAALSLKRTQTAEAFQRLKPAQVLFTERHFIHVFVPQTPPHHLSLDDSTLKHCRPHQPNISCDVRNPAATVGQNQALKFKTPSLCGALVSDRGRTAWDLKFDCRLSFCFIFKNH